MPKLGKISASMAKDVMTSGRGKDEPFGATFLSRAKSVGAGRIGWDVSVDLDGNPDIERGRELEWEAVETYMEERFADVHSAQIWQSIDGTCFGCTPDGLVGTDGMIEVKAPRSHNHLANILEQAQLKQYIPQMQFSLWVTGRQWCDFISFDPTAPDGLKLYVYRVERDEVYIESLSMRAFEMDRIADEYADVLKQITNKQD